MGTARIRELSLVGPDGVIATSGGEGITARVEGSVERGWVYAKVVQEDGEMAWSSPVFVDPRT